MIRFARTSIALLALLAGSSPLAAQLPTVIPPPSPGPSSVRAVRAPAFVRYGKWALLGGAVAINLQALHEHNLANDTFAQLRDRCSFTSHGPCDTGADGRYLDPESESIYQASLSADRHARSWLFAGEAVLLGSAAMFVWELSRPNGPTKNVPFVPHVERTASGRANLGISLAF